MTDHAGTAGSLHEPGLAFHPRAALLCLLGGTFVVTLDFFIVAVALPSIQADLAASQAQLQWVVAAYGLVFASALVACGRIGDQLGRRRLFGAGVAVFTAASAGCGLAPDAGTLIAARALQGLGAAAITPQVLAMLGTLYAGRRRAWAFSWYGLALGGAATSGQLVGGLLIEADPGGLGWRACFLVNLPVGLALLAMLRAAVPRIAPQAGSRPDLAGAALLAAALAGLLWPVIEGRQAGWPAWSAAVIAAAFAVLALFARHQARLAARGASPLMPPDLLRAPGFASGLGAALAFYLTNGSFYFVLALYLQQGRGLDALAGGIVFTALALGFFATSLATPALLQRWGNRVIVLGAGLTAAGHLAQYLLAVQAPGGAPLPLVAALLALQGAGIGLVMSPLAATVLACAPARHAGVASGVFATAQWAGNALGVALIGIPFHGALAGAAGAAAGFRQGFAAALLWLAALTLVFGALILARRR